MAETTAIPAAPTWSWAQRFLFRWFCAFFVLYVLPFPIGAIPGTGALANSYSELWNAVVPWVGEHALGVTITVQPNGSGDTTYNFVQVGIFAAGATGLALLWSLLARGRPHEQTAHRWLRTLIRYYLSVNLIAYGMVKVFPLQFPPPTFDRLLQPYGDSSPMGLLWTFMGASPTYVMFAGAAEVVAGLLLAWRRTTLLGALLGAGVLANVVMLNFCYDVPVKLFSSHLLAMALFLLLPDVRRLADFFLFHRPVEPRSEGQLFGSWRWLNRLAAVAGVLFIGSLLVEQFLEVGADRLEKAQAPLRGIWRVEEFRVAGELLPPLLTDKVRWRRQVFDLAGLTTVQMMDGERVRWLVEVDDQRQLLRMRFPNQPTRKAELRYEKPAPDRLTVSGTYEGKAIEVKMVLEPAGDFLLLSRGFHWINEYPFNR